MWRKGKSLSHATDWSRAVVTYDCNKPSFMLLNCVNDRSVTVFIIISCAVSVFPDVQRHNCFWIIAINQVCVHTRESENCSRIRDQATMVVKFTTKRTNDGEYGHGSAIQQDTATCHLERLKRGVVNRRSGDRVF
jgi:hypothetical protein